MAAGKKIKIITVLLSFTVISGVLSIAVNPLEFISFARDRQRRDDLKNLSLVIEQAEFEHKETIKAKKQIVYVSLPDDNSDCSGWIGRGLPDISRNFNYHCVDEENLRDIDGSGWLPIDLTLLAAVPFDQLPIDPLNGKRSRVPETGDDRLFFYQYISGSFSLGAFSESPPAVDESYSAAKSQLVVKTLTGLDPVGVGAAVGGRMIAAGSVELLSEVNAPQISAEELKINDDAARDAPEEVKQVLAIIAQRPDIPVQEAIGIGLGALGIRIEPTATAQEFFSEISDKPVDEYLREVAPVESEEPAPEPPPEPEPEPEPEQSSPPAEPAEPVPAAEEEVEEDAAAPPPPSEPPTGPACFTDDGGNTFVVCGRESDVLTDDSCAGAILGVCATP